jgi:hypothetical protein
MMRRRRRRRRVMTSRCFHIPYNFEVKTGTEVLFSYYSSNAISHWPHANSLEKLNLTMSPPPWIEPSPLSFPIYFALLVHHHPRTLKNIASPQCRLIQAFTPSNTIKKAIQEL